MIDIELSIHLVDERGEDKTWVPLFLRSFEPWSGESFQGETDGTGEATFTVPGWATYEVWMGARRLERVRVRGGHDRLTVWVD